MIAKENLKKIGMISGINPCHKIVPLTLLTCGAFAAGQDNSCTEYGKEAIEAFESIDKKEQVHYALYIKCVI